MHIENFKKYMTAELLMGPNSARILEALWKKHPLSLTADDMILDLGCGKGLTSLLIAKETSAKVYATDLWISAEDNEKRFAEWGLNGQVVPVHADANTLPFAERIFQAMVSVDAYHYFGTKPEFFNNNILPFLANRAELLIGVPGIKEEYRGRSDELLSAWLQNDACLFQSPTAWREIIGKHDRIATVETWEMDCFDLAWNEWFATEHPYSLGDKQFFETLIQPYTCFVGIYSKLN